MTTPLTRLVRLAPPVLTPSPVDWGVVEGQLGVSLPQDYKELADTYGGGEFDGHIGLCVPGASHTDADLVVFNDGHMADYEDLWELNGSRPAMLAQEGVLLITWASTIDADDLNWLIRPGERPDDWPIVVLNDDLTIHETFPMTCTRFLADLLAGDIESDILSSGLTPPSHTFRPYRTD
jgi:hypothetical protein